MKNQEWFSRYIDGYDLIIYQLQQIPAQAIHFKPAPNQWSISEIIVHLADSEVNGFVRAKKIIAESGSTVTVYEQEAWANALHYDLMDYQDALELIKVLRKNLYSLLKLIDEKTWNNYIFHPEIGKITLMDWIQLYIDHIDIHIQQMHRNFYDWRKVNEKELA